MISTRNMFLRGKPQSGVTLVELMVVVAIIGILAIIAYPSYTSHLVKGRRASAQAHLMDIAQLEQQYFLDARRYATGSNALTTLNITTPSDVSAHYNVITISAVTGPPAGFTATAEPKAGTAQAGDGALSINHVGAKLPTDKW